MCQLLAVSTSTCNFANTSGTARTLSYGYDANSNRTSITHPDGVVTYYDHDGLDRVTLIREWDNDPLASFGYDVMGRRAHIVRGNGAVTFYAYDGASRLSEMMQDLPGTASDIWTPFGYNPASQISSTSRSNDAYVWTGHGSGSTASTVNGLNQLVTVGGVAFAHDLNGNLTNDGQGRSFTYDSENRLVSSTANGVTVTLAYDPLGRLYQVSGPSGITRFLYGGDRLIAEYDGAGTLLRRYVHGEGVDQPLVRYENGARAFYHADERGSVIALSNDAGNAIAINSYDEYGNPGNGAVAGRFGYTGQIWIPELGLYYYKARFYHPKLGRFLQVDPLLYADGMNPYIYTHNDPVNFTDPSGMVEQDITVTGPSCSIGVLMLPNEHTLGNSSGAYCLISSGGGGGNLIRDPGDQACHPTGRWGRPVCGDEWRERPKVEVKLASANTGNQDWCGSGGTAWVPDGVWAEGCRKHDDCYGTPGRSRESCDAAILGDIIRECQKSKISCVGVAMLYYIMVRFFGGSPYSDAQSNHRIMPSRR